MSNSAPSPRGLSDVHDAVLVVYDSLRAVFFTCFPTTTNPEGKSPPAEAKKRLDAIIAGLLAFPEKLIKFDPFFGLIPAPVRLEYTRTLVEKVEGDSLHDAVVRLGWRVYDSLRLAKYGSVTGPETGETIQAPRYASAVETETTVVIDGQEQTCKARCLGGGFETEHFSELPWSSALWDRMYDEFGTRLGHYCWGNSDFHPWPGKLRDGLRQELKMGYVRGRLRLDGAPPPSPPAGSTNTPPTRWERIRMSHEAIEAKVKELVAKDPVAFFIASRSKQAQMIGCDQRTWEKNPLYATHGRSKQKKGTGREPKSVELTDSIKAGVSIKRDKDSKSDTLKRLMEESAADYEPSPLDDDESQPDERPRRRRR